MNNQKFLWPIAAMMCALACIFALTGCEQPNSEIKVDKPDGPENYEWAVKLYDDGYFTEDPSSLLDGWRLVRSEGSDLTPVFLNDIYMEDILGTWYGSQESVGENICIVTRRDVSNPTDWTATTWDGYRYSSEAHKNEQIDKLSDNGKKMFSTLDKFVILYRPKGSGSVDSPDMPKLAVPMIDAFQDKAGNVYEHGVPYIVVSLAEGAEYPEGTRLELAVTAQGETPEFTQVENGAATPYGGRKTATVTVRAVCEGFSTGTTEKILTPVYRENDVTLAGGIFSTGGEDDNGYETRLILLKDYDADSALQAEYSYHGDPESPLDIDVGMQTMGNSLRSAMGLEEVQFVTVVDKTENKRLRYIIHGYHQYETALIDADAWDRDKDYIMVERPF